MDEETLYINRARSMRSGVGGEVIYGIAYFLSLIFGAVGILYTGIAVLVGLKPKSKKSFRGPFGVLRYSFGKVPIHCPACKEKQFISVERKELKCCECNSNLLITWYDKECDDKL